MKIFSQKKLKPLSALQKYRQLQFFFRVFLCFQFVFLLFVFLFFRKPVVYKIEYKPVSPIDKTTLWDVSEHIGFPTNSNVKISPSFSVVPSTNSIVSSFNTSIVNIGKIDYHYFVSDNIPFIKFGGNHYFTEGDEITEGVLLKINPDFIDVFFDGKTNRYENTNLRSVRNNGVNTHDRIRAVNSIP